MAKKTSYLLLAGTLLLLSALPGALAAETGPPAPTPTAIYPASPTVYPEGGPPTVFEGHIKPTIISAIVTSEIGFTMDTTKTETLALGEEPGGTTLTLTKTTYPETAMVQNTSVFPVQVSVAGVAVESSMAQEKGNVVLVDTLAAADVPYQVLLVLGQTSPPYVNESDFLSNALLVTDDKTHIPIIADHLGVGERVNLRIYGKTAPTGEDFGFKVTATLRIAQINAPEP